jgi:hypothetical protein
MLVRHSISTWKIFIPSVGAQCRLFSASLSPPHQPPRPPQPFTSDDDDDWNNWEFGSFTTKTRKTTEQSQAQRTSQNKQSQVRRNIDNEWSVLSDEEVEAGIRALKAASTSSRILKLEAVLERRTSNIRFVFVSELT